MGLRASRPAGESEHRDVVELSPLVRRVIAVRVRDRHVVDDLVQETLTRLMEAHRRLDPQTLAPYAVVTARNLVASLAASENRSKRHAHRLIDLREPELPERELLRREESRAVSAALARLPPREREALVAHEVEGEDTSSKPQQEDLQTVRELIEAGKVTPLIDRTYPLREVPEAVRYLVGGHGGNGKVVITV